MTKNKHFLKAIAVAQTYFITPAKPQTRTNPHTGKRHELEPLAVMLHDFIISPRIEGLIKAGAFTLTTWNNARYAFAEMWPDAYYDLID